MQLPQTGGAAAAPGVSNPFNDVLYGASSGILGTYLGNSKEYVQSNVCVSATPVHSNTVFQLIMQEEERNTVLATWCHLHLCHCYQAICLITCSGDLLSEQT
jgi:hypothetical protein